MRLGSIEKTLRRRGLALVALGLVVAMNACGLDEVKVPALVGPSEGGLSLQMTAIPDKVSADGVSQAVVRILARDQNGRPAPSRMLFVTLGGSADGVLVAGSVLVGPLETGVALSTDTNGIAQVVYTAGTIARTRAQIRVTPFSFDATDDPFQSEKVVYIEQL